MKLVYKIEADKYFFLDTMTGACGESFCNERSNVVSNDSLDDFLNQYFFHHESYRHGKIETCFFRERWALDGDIHNGIKIEFKTNETGLQDDFQTLPPF